jgi:septum formation protein
MWVGGVDVTELRMRQLASAELEAYLDSNRWVDKAGAYAIQDPDPYVTIIRGSYSNVVGLPLELVNRLLHSVRHQTGASAG